MYRTLLLGAFLIGLPAAAERAGSMHYTCDMDGDEANLTAEFEFVTFEDTTDMLVELANAPARLFYSGELTSPGVHYIFNGEDNIAEFTDLATQERFLVQIDRDGDNLRLTTNPHTDNSRLYFCQTAIS